MPDPIKKFVSPPDFEPTLFESSSHEAGRVAARFAGVRYRQVLSILSETPACIFEIAAKLGCQDHQISGRFGELVRANCIRRTGTRRLTPSGKTHAEEYAITLKGLAVLEAASNPPQTEGK